MEETCVTLDPSPPTPLDIHHPRRLEGSNSQSEQTDFPTSPQHFVTKEPALSHVQQHSAPASIRDIGGSLTSNLCTSWAPRFLGPCQHNRCTCISFKKKQVTTHLRSTTFWHRWLWKLHLLTRAQPCCGKCRELLLKFRAAFLTHVFKSCALFLHPNTMSVFHSSTFPRTHHQPRKITLSPRSHVRDTDPLPLPREPPDTECPVMCF